MFSYLYPQASHFEEPSVQQPRGRPKNNPTARDPSAWEYTFQKFSIGRSSSGSDRGRRHSSSGSRGRGKSSSGSVGREASRRGRASSSSSGKGNRLSSSSAPLGNIPAPPSFTSTLPQFIIPHIQGYVDVIGDGNCGYRCVAQVVYGQEDQWMIVRRQLFDEMESRWAMYVNVFGEGDAAEQYASRVIASLCHWDNAPAPTSRWMTLSDVGLVIATAYKAIVLELSAQQCITHLPLASDPIAEQISHFIPIMYIAPSQHFIQLTLRDNCPLPPINPQWMRYREPSVEHLQLTLRPRTRRWELLAAAM